MDSIIAKRDYIRAFCTFIIKPVNCKPTRNSSLRDNKKRKQFSNLPFLSKYHLAIEVYLLTTQIEKTQQNEGASEFF